MSEGLITSRSEFHAALRLAFAEAATAGSHALWLADPDFGDWPLGEREVVDSLSRWVASSRHFTIVARDFDAIARRHPRWVTWRRQWAHVVTCRTNAELEAGEMPTLLLASGTVTVRLSDAVHHRGRLARDGAEELRCKEVLDAVLQRSEEAFPATTTGL